MATLRERLQAVLGLNTREFDRGLDRSGKKAKQVAADTSRGFATYWSQMSGIGKSVIAGLGIGAATYGLQGMVSAGRDTIKSIAQIGDEAKRAGVEVEAFQEWGYVARQNRIDIGALTDAFKELSLRADEFVVTGKGSAAEAFQRLGFTAAELKTKLKDPSALMLEIIGRLEGLDKAAQIRIADEIFGGTGGERFVELLDQGEAGIRKVMGEAKSAGAVIDAEMVKRADELDKRFAAIQERLAGGFKAAVVTAGEALLEAGGAGQLSELMHDLERARAILGGDLADALINNAALIEDNAAGISELNQRTWELTNTADELATAYFDLADAAFALGDAETAQALVDAGVAMDALVEKFKRGEINVDQLATGLLDVRTRADEAVGALGDADALSMSSIIGEVNALEGALASAAGMAQGLWSWLAGIAGVGMGEGGEAGLSRNPFDVGGEPMTSSPRPQRPGVDSYGGWVEDSKPTKSGGGGASRPDDYAARTKAIRDEIAALDAEAAALIAAAQGGQVYGSVMDYARKKAELLNAAQKAGKEITPELEAEIDQLARAYAVAADNAEDVEEKLREIEEAGQRGVDAMTDIFGSVIDGSRSAREAVADLLREMAMVQLRKGLLGLSGSGGGFFGWVGGLLGANANGTTNWSGGISLVGERGAELVSMPRGSQVFSALDTQRMLEGGASGLNIHVTASFDETGNLYVKDVARREAASAVAQADKALPARVQQINANPRRR